VTITACRSPGGYDVAAAERDQYPLPDMPAAGNLSAGAESLRVAGQLGGQPQQGQLAQSGQVSDPEPARQRVLRLLRRVDASARRPPGLRGRQDGR
jgi:hypothetical protein